MRQRFIQSFPTREDIQSALDNKELGKPYVAFSREDQSIYWNTKNLDMDYLIPLTFEVTDAGTIVWKKGGDSAPARTIQYSINNGSWQSITANDTAGTEINVSVGDVVQFKGNNTSYASDIANSCSFAGTAKYYAYGNIMSLIYGDNFIDKTTLTETYTFPRLFYGATGLKSHSTHKLVLPATTLTDYCYRNIFEDCTSLTQAPILPATTLTDYCYGYMFLNCTSLTQAPSLPATTLATGCYSNMFQGCTSLVNAPALPATELVNQCYADMFKGCTSLTQAPVLLATALGFACYLRMFQGCASLVNAPALPATTLTESCYDSMFAGCTNLTTAPELPASTLVGTNQYNGCYRSMFSNCTNLNYIKCLATDISATGCTTGWVNNVASSGTFVKHPDATWSTGESGIPTGWTVENATV